MRALYDSESKSLDDKGIKQLLTEEEKYKSWLVVESALAQAQGELGIIPKEAANQINKSAKIENIDFDQMNEIQKQVGHGFVPFLKTLVSVCDDESSKYVHFGATTQNIQQTGQNLTMKSIHIKFKEFVIQILENLNELAEKNKYTVMAGRTHGKHAIPITYGYKVSVWIYELTMSFERLEEVEKRVFSVMMGGAVGAYNSMGEEGPLVQKRVASILELEPMLVPSRNISSTKIEYINTLQLLANVLHKIAEEVFQTSIEEFGEVSEGFTKGTIGSSTMPHKINPKLSKGIIANAQLLYSLSTVGYVSAARPFESDSSSNMLFDGLINESLELMTEILIRAEKLTKTLVVHEDKLKENANLNQGLDNSEFIMMKLAEKLGKDKAHELVYELAIESEVSNKNYKEVLLENSFIMDFFTESELEELLKPENYIGLSSQIVSEVVAYSQNIINEFNSRVSRS